MNLDFLKSVAISWFEGNSKFNTNLQTESDLFSAYTNLNLNDSLLLNVMEELYLNSLEHGSSPVDIFLEPVKDILLFGIWDKGIGIHNSLPKNPKLSDTKDKSSSAIIRLSLEEYISGTGQAGRGVGLHLLSSYVSRSNAELFIWSNKSWVYQIKSDFYETPSEKDVVGNMTLLKVHK